MNRLATVRNLPSALDLQQSVQQLQMLMHEMRQEIDQSRQQITSLHSDLASLPLAVAKELSDLGRLSETLDVALRAQRQALSQTAKQMAEASVAQLDSIAASTNAQSEFQAQSLLKITTRLDQSTEALMPLSTLPRQVKTAVKSLNETTNRLNRSRAWVLALAIVGSSVLSALLVVGSLHLLGVLDSGKQAPQSAQAQQSQPANAWEKVNALTRGR